MTQNLTNMDQSRTFIEVLYDGATYIESVVGSITWSGDVTQAHRELNFTMKNTLDGKTRAVPIEVGKSVQLFSDGVELFRGIIFDTNIDSSGTMDVKAFDETIYLTKNMDSRRFVNKTASAIVQELCEDFGVDVGTVEDTGYVIPKLILRSMNLWEMMMTALTVTYRQTGRRFFIFGKEGKLCLVERKSRVATYILEDSTNIISASYNENIEDMRNQIKVTGNETVDDGETQTGTKKTKKQEIETTVKNADLIAKYGLMQHLESAGPDATQSALKQLAEHQLEQLGKVQKIGTLEALGFDDVISGVSLYVYEEMTGLIGSYYVSTDSHTFESGVHKMSLTLSLTDDLPVMDYDKPPTDKLEKAKKGDSGASTLEEVLQLINKRSNQPEMNDIG